MHKGTGSYTLITQWGNISMFGNIKCLCKSGPVDFARDKDLAHFLCIVRHSCAYTKTTICLIGSLYFQSFAEIKFHLSEGLS